MHLQRLKIISYRNLIDFEISFTQSTEDDDGIRHDFKSHAVIGQNGIGKSNLLEAIIMIFRDLDLNNAAGLDYEMDYAIRGHSIRFVAESGKKPKVAINGERRSAGTLADHARQYLPSHVFVYYSGKNERIEQLFLAHQKRFTQQLRKGRDEGLSGKPFHVRSNYIW